MREGIDGEPSSAISLVPFVGDLCSSGRVGLEERLGTIIHYFCGIFLRHPGSLYLEINRTTLLPSEKVRASAFGLPNSRSLRWQMGAGCPTSAWRINGSREIFIRRCGSFGLQDTALAVPQT